MLCIIIGALLSIGWHLVKFIYGFIDEVVTCRLHNTKWYARLCGKGPKKENKVEQSTERRKIGFE